MLNNKRTKLQRLVERQDVYSIHQCVNHSRDNFTLALCDEHMTRLAV